MNPITGPFNKTVYRRKGTQNVIVRWNRSSWYRQKRPYNLPLNFYTHRVESIASVLRLPDDPQPSGGVTQGFSAFWRPYVIDDKVSGDPNVPWFTSRINTVQAKALTRFNDKRGEAAALGVTLVQYRQAIDMMADRLLQGWRVISALRKGKLGTAANLLGVRKSSVRSRARELSSLQLEISFGWLPMIADVQSALKVLNGPLPYGRARGSASLSDTLKVPNGGRMNATHQVKFMSYVEAFLQVDNPGLDVAQRLGLIDPLPILYEVIPWSFVANWIFNLDEYIGQYNGYHGVTVTNPHWGIKIIDVYEMLEPNPTQPSESWFGRGFGESFQRTVGSLPTIRLGLRPSVNMPWQRALNAISLLIQKGIKGR